MPCLRECVGGGLSGSKPAAWTIVPWRVLMGGISTNSGCVVFVLVQYGRGSLAGVLSWNGGGGGSRGLVFGTLLGPEATGPGRVCPCPGLFVSGFLAAPVTWLPAFAGVCGVCGTGLLFENYIVDASILYKKQFPRIWTWIWPCTFLGCGVGFRGSLEITP